MKKRFVFAALLVISLLASIGCGASARSATLTIYHAGSLSVPFADLETEFETIHPGVDVLFESGGSNKKISDWLTREEAGEAPPDILASADYSLIPGRTYEDDYADWTIIFAQNKMVLCYTDSSAHANDVTTANWYEVLQRDGVTYGHSNPDEDPCGYRTLMVMQLAEAYYFDRAAEFGVTPDDDADDLYSKLIGGTDDPLHAGRPEYANDAETVLSKSVDLIARLESGDLDYAFEYRSVAVQHELNFVELVDPINLSATGEIGTSGVTYTDFYKNESSVTLNTAPDEPKKGKAIVYGITIPNNAENPELAWEFIQLLIGKTGRDIFTAQGQPPISPATCDHPDLMPTQIVQS